MSVVRSLRPLSRLSRLCRRLPLLTLHPDLPRLRQGTCRLISSDHHSELQFEKKIDNALESLNDQLEEVLCRANIKDYDVSLNSGVLTVSLGEFGTYVINKQSANQQIWLSSPISGPKRYDLSGGMWTYHRNGQTLDQLLSQELSAILKESVTVKVE